MKRLSTLLSTSRKFPLGLMPQRNITSRYSGLEGASYNVVEEKIFLCRRQVPVVAVSTAVGLVRKFMTASKFEFSGDNWFDFSANAAVPPRPLATQTCILKSASSFNPLSIFQKMYMLNLSFFSLGCDPQCKTFVAHHDCNICSHVHPKLFVQQG